MLLTTYKTTAHLSGAAAGPPGTAAGPHGGKDTMLAIGLAFGAVSRRGDSRDTTTRGGQAKTHAPGQHLGGRDKKDLRGTPPCLLRKRLWRLKSPWRSDRRCRWTLLWLARTARLRPPQDHTLQDQRRCPLRLRPRGEAVQQRQVRLGRRRSRRVCLRHTRRRRRVCRARRCHRRIRGWHRWHRRATRPGENRIQLPFHRRRTQEGAAQKRRVRLSRRRCRFPLGRCSARSSPRRARPNCHA